MGLLLALLLAVSLVPVLLIRIEPRELEQVPAWHPETAGQHLMGPTILEGRTLEEVRRRFDDAYRVAPDRRFLLAVQDVDEILGREHSAIGTATFEGSGWSLAAGGSSVHVTEYPDFGELYGFVRTSIAEGTRGATMPFTVLNSGADQAYPAYPLSALEAIDRRADSVDLVAAAYAYARLLLSHEDTLEVSDEVAARAVAVLALAEDSAGEALVRPRVLIAHRLGYEREAEEMAAALPPSDPVRLFAERDFEALEALASQANAPVDLSLLYARLLTIGEKREQFIRYVASLRPELRNDFGILALDAVHGTALAPDLLLLARTIGDLALASGTAIALDPKLQDQIAAQEAIARLLSQPPYGLLGLAESLLAKLTKDSSGRLLDPATRAAVYRTQIYTGFDSVASDLVARLNSASASTEFATLLGRGKSAAADQFERYLAARIAAQERRLGANEAVANIAQLGFGPRSLEILFHPMSEGNYDALWLEAIKLLFRRADTRVDHRTLLADIASRGLFDIALNERLERSVAREWPHEAYWHALVSFRDGDHAGVQRWLTDRSVSPWMRANLLPLIKGSDFLSKGETRGLYERLIEIDPTDWSVAKKYVEFLENDRDYPQARRVIDVWLARSDRRSGMEELVARTALARAYHKEGNLDAAWEAVAQPLAGMYGDAFRRAALIRLDQGTAVEAEAICRRALERYPGNIPTAASLARVFWRQDRHDEAAAVLKEQVAQIGLIEWRRAIAPDFIEEFANSPPERIDAAVASLGRAGFHPSAIEQISFKATEAQEPDLAFQLLSTTPLTQFESLDPISSAYRSLEQLRGREEALRWLEERVPASYRPGMSHFGYGGGSYELQWEFVPDPVGHGRLDDYIWILRAASYLRDGATRSDWRARLDDYYSSAPDSFYNKIGAMVIGRLEPSDVWITATQLDQRVEAAYFIAVRAEASGDLEMAIAWYRIALESGLRREAEPHWSLNQLSRLRQQGKSVARLRTARGVTSQYSGT